MAATALGVKPGSPVEARAPGMLRLTYLIGTQLIVAGIIDDRLCDADRGNYDGSAAAVTEERATRQ
jgi:hypothetical protein